MIGLWKIEEAISISSSFAPPLPAAKRREDYAKVYNANELALNTGINIVLAHFFWQNQNQFDLAGAGKVRICLND